MKKPIIIHVQSDNPELESPFFQFFQELCSQEELVCKLIEFPSEGPLGYQLKITTNNRIHYHPYPLEALILIDKMDFFLNPMTGIFVNPGNNFDILLIIQTKQAKQKIIDPNWLKEINKILPQPDQIIKLKMLHGNEPTNKITIERIIMVDNEENLLQKPNFITMLQKIKIGEEHQ